MRMNDSPFFAVATQVNSTRLHDRLLALEPTRPMFRLNGRVISL
jgi:hypothetical protein